MSMELTGTNAIFCITLLALQRIYVRGVPYKIYKPVID